MPIKITFERFIIFGLILIAAFLIFVALLIFYPPSILWLLGNLKILPIDRILTSDEISSESAWKASGIHHYNLEIERTWVGGAISKETEHPCKQYFEILDEQVINTRFDTCVSWPKLGLPSDLTISGLFEMIKNNRAQLEWRDLCTLFVAYPQYNSQYGYPTEIRYQTENPSAQNMGVQGYLTKYPSGYVSLDCLDNFAQRPTLKILTLTIIP